MGNKINCSLYATFEVAYKRMVTYKTMMGVGINE